MVDWRVRLIHLRKGWRYWVFDPYSMDELGDYPTEAEARAAIAADAAEGVA